MRFRHLRSTIVLLSLLGTEILADEVLFSVGAGPQPHSAQRNDVLGFDYSFYTFKRSARQHLQVGVSYTRLRTNVGPSRDLHAISIYPQLTFFPTPTSAIFRHLPEGAQPFFFTRMLGPSYISEPTLGDRQQANHFSFQAAVGVGVDLKMRNERRALINVSWRHFSNARLFRPNDGLDVPFVLSLGIKY